MAIENLKETQTIEIGRQLENKATLLQFNLAEFATEFGSGTAKILHKRSCDSRPYIANTTKSGNTLSWPITSADTCYAGTGYAEIQYYVGDVRAKSAVFRTNTIAALVDADSEQPGAVVYVADGSQIEVNKQEIEKIKQDVSDISETGKNLYNGDDVDKTVTSSVYTEVTLQNPLAAGTYTISAVVKSTSTAHDVTKCNIRVRGDSGELAAMTMPVGHPSRSSATFTIAETAKSIRCYGSTGTSAEYTVDTSEFRNIQIESGSTATSYAAYKLTACDEIARSKTFTETYYVSTTGSDENKGTAAEPFATIGKAIANGAKVVSMEKGTYTENLRKTTKTDLKIIGNGSTIQYSSGQNACLEFRLSNIEIYDLTFDATEGTGATGSISGVFLRDCTARLVNCKVNGSPYMGFRLDGSKVTLERCEAAGCGVDGFNAHDTANNVSDGTFIDCISHDNNDDGLSYHENGSIHVHGGKYYDNHSTGIAPNNGCNCEIIGAYIYGNGSGIEAFNTNSTVSPYPKMVCTGCIITGNTSDETARGYGISAKYYSGVVNACAIEDNQKGDVVQDANSNIVVY